MLKVWMDRKLCAPCLLSGFARCWFTLSKCVVGWWHFWESNCSCVDHPGPICFDEIHWPFILTDWGGETCDRMWCQVQIFSRIFEHKIPLLRKSFWKVFFWNYCSFKDEVAAKVLYLFLSSILINRRKFTFWLRDSCQNCTIVCSNTLKVVISLIANTRFVGVSTCKILEGWVYPSIVLEIISRFFYEWFTPSAACVIWQMTQKYCILNRTLPVNGLRSQRVPVS